MTDNTWPDDWPIKAIALIEKLEDEVASQAAEIERLKLYEDWTPDEHKRVVAQLADKDAEIAALREQINELESQAALANAALAATERRVRALHKTPEADAAVDRMIADGDTP